MLTVLRAAAQTWVAKVLFFLLVASFAVWGVSGSMLSGTGDAVVTVGDTTVSPTEFRLAYDRQIALLSQRFGTRITREQARALGLENQIYSQLVSGAALDELADDMNLGLSRGRLAGLIAEDPAFQGLDGDFSRQAFSSVLANVGMSEEDYIRNREDVAVRTQIIEAVSDGFTLPETVLDAVARHRAATRTVNYIVVDESMIEPVGEPDEETLQAYFEENKARYRAPEFRKISYVTLTTDDVADPAAISDDAVRSAYEDNAGNYSTPERRTLDQLVFSDAQSAEAAAQQLAEGADFAEIVEAEGRRMEDVRIGSFTREEMSSTALGDAAFAVEEEGGVTGVVEGPFGPVILRVAEIEAGGTQPFEEVSDKIRQDLALQGAGDALFDLYNAYEDARAGGMSLEEAAKELQLEPVVVEAVDETGRNPEGETVELPQAQELLTEAFQTEVGFEPSPLTIGSEGYLWYEVLDVQADRDRTLDEVRDQVVADWTADQTAEALAARAGELVERLAGGESLQEIAADVGAQVETEYGLQRQSDDPLFGDTAIAAAFGGPRGHTAMAPVADGSDRLVMQVTDTAISASDGLPEDERQAIADNGASALLDQMIVRLQTQYPVQIDESLGQQALSF